MAFALVPVECDIEGVDMSARSASSRSALSYSPKWILADLCDLRHVDQLVCLPHAGGSASAYRSWLAPVSGVVDVLPVQLPGRETRIKEPLEVDFERLTGKIADVLYRAELPNVSLFGHSMGALLAVAVCGALERAGTPVRHLFVSGHPGMRFVPRDSRLMVGVLDTDETLSDSLAALDPVLGLPQNEELRAMFLPVLRADLMMLRNLPPMTRVSTPITALGGSDDPLLAGFDLSGWAKLTDRDCVTHRLPGGHFHLQHQSEAIAPIIRERLGISPDGQH
ncbi:thioesterase II family protein [Amycolatopsis lurida]